MALTPRKTSILTVRVTPEVKAALQGAATIERRSLANMLEVAVLAYCKAAQPGTQDRGAKKPGKTRKRAS